MAVYVLAITAVVTLLGVTLVRTVLWWGLVVIPAIALAAYLIWTDAAWAMFALATLGEIVVLSVDAARENERRAAAGIPPLTEAQLRARCVGKRTEG